MTHPPGHQALRKGRTTLPGQIYLVTTVTDDRVPHFLDIELARAACRSMIELKTWGDAHPICWVLMPDHWHELITLGDRDDLSLVMNRFKSLICKAMVRAGHHGHVWARGFHDHALRADEDIHTAMRYIIANPLRAGLVDHVNDYPYWNCTGLL